MKLTIPIDVIPQGRPRFTRTGIAYDPPECRKFKAGFALTVISMLSAPEPFTGAVRVTLGIYRNKKSAISRKFGDVDNLAKIILDAITDTGAVWKDDSQIVDLRVTKAIADTPRVEISIEEIPDND